MSAVLPRTFPAATATVERVSPQGRIGRRLIPFPLVRSLSALIDRLNLGFAKLQFLSDPHLDEAVYGVAAGILCLASVLFEVPSDMLLAGAAACIFGVLALFWTTASGMMGADGAAVGIAFLSSVGAVGYFLSPTFIGWTRDATGSFTGAVDALAALMLVATAMLWRTL